MLTEQIRPQQTIETASTNFTSYEEALAASLIVYAQHDRAFSKKLKTLAKEHSFEPEKDTRISYSLPSGALVPANRNIAMAEVQWLLTQDDISAKKLLHSWATSTEPKNIIIGIVGLAIIGLTLGLVKWKKNIDMAIVVRDDKMEGGAANFSKLVHRASAGVIAAELRKAKGMIPNLEPIFSEWLFGEKNITIYSANLTKMKAIQKDASELHAVHLSIVDEKGITVIALSPSLSGRAETIWNLEPVEP